MDREQELQRRIEQLEERLQQTEKDLEGFLYAISHDLRGPLRTIMASSMIVLEDYGDRLDEEGRRELERQRRAAGKLSALVDDVLRLSRLGRQEISPVPLDLTAVVREVAVKSAPNAELEIEEGLNATADPVLVRTLLQNLLENATKFHRPDEPAKIAVGTQNGAFFVRDQGIGFEPQQAERIFKPFERLHPDGIYPGSGIGLSLARIVTQRHGGKIWAEGESGKGATLWFTLAPEAV